MSPAAVHPSAAGLTCLHEEVSCQPELLELTVKLTAPPRKQEASQPASTVLQHPVDGSSSLTLDGACRAHTAVSAGGTWHAWQLLAWLQRRLAEPAASCRHAANLANLGNKQLQRKHNCKLGFAGDVKTAASWCMRAQQCNPVETHRVPPSYTQAGQQALGREHAHGATKEVLHAPPAHVCGVLWCHAVREALWQQVAADQTQQAALMGLGVIHLRSCGRICMSWMDC